MLAGPAEDSLDLSELVRVLAAIKNGDFKARLRSGRGETAAQVAEAVNAMAAHFADQDWLKTSLARMTRMLQGQRDQVNACRLVLSELAALLGFQQGAVYLLEGREGGAWLRLLGSYAHRKELPISFRLGEGLVGQCALERRRFVVDELPDDYLRIGSALGESRPRAVVLLPVLFEGQTQAVIELAAFQPLRELDLIFLDLVAEPIGVALNTIASNMRTEELLRQSQLLAQSLQRQQIELRETNEALQQKARLLSQQKEETLAQSRELELGRRSLEEKAEQLALTSKYKSQFLANMSHELRTPLNSMLILAKMLADNSDGNMTAKQVEFAKTVHSAGAELLALINEILDMSKIESGTMTLEIGAVSLAELASQLERQFRPIAQGRGLDFVVELARAMPENVATDAKRLQQILKNLLSNAFKFTERGAVRLTMAPYSKDRLAFSVSDTGIGIPADKQKIIFEAFQQADMTTSRRYGGTGLGLAISREIALRLGGEISIESAPGKGSVFTLLLPRGDCPPSEERPRRSLGSWLPFRLGDHAPSSSTAGAVMVVEEDVGLSLRLIEAARAAALKTVVAQRGDLALSLVRKTPPAAIMLDSSLPDMSGWRVLDQLKRTPSTRHIPVVIVAEDACAPRATRLGAFGRLDKKTVAPGALKAALDELQSRLKAPPSTLYAGEGEGALPGLAGDRVRRAASAEEFLAGASSAACVVVDLSLPWAWSALDGLKGARQCPAVLVRVDRALDAKAGARLRRLSRRLPLKTILTEARLFSECSLHLHLPVAEMSPDQRRLLDEAERLEPALSGKTILVVDDDPRNIFAITAALERQKARVLSAENGRDALALLESAPEVDAVLLDVMMPDMDGYEAMREIRSRPRLRSLPIISITAKALKDDREKCIQAGATDYAAKPVDEPQLLSLLRVWAL